MRRRGGRREEAGEGEGKFKSDGKDERMDYRRYIGIDQCVRTLPAS